MRPCAARGLATTRTAYPQAASKRDAAAPEGPAPMMTTS